MAKKSSRSKRRKRHSPSSSRSSGGVFSSMRGGMKNLVGTGGKKKGKRPLSFWDVLFWIAAGLLGAAVIYRWLN